MVARQSVTFWSVPSRLRACGALAALGASSLAYYYFAPGSAHAENKPANTPSVYLWGDNSRGLIASGRLAPSAVRVPTRVPFLDNQTLRSLAACPEFALAALQNGDVVQWASPTESEVILKSKKVAKLLISPRSHIALALSNDGSLWTWTPASPETAKPQRLKAAELGWFEKVVSVECGVDHVLALTNKGRVFSAALRPGADHHGQLGIANFPHFEPLPPVGQLHHVKLLESSVTQIACGAFHSLFLTKSGDLFGCGSNQFGQLMLPYTYRNTKVSVPTKLPTAAVSPSGVSAVAAGSSVTYFKSSAPSSSSTGSVSSPGLGSWFVAGDGEYGQFGTGSFSQCQVSPLRLVPFESMREYDEKLGRVVPISIATDGWRIGGTHVFASVNNPARDWFVWGSNERGQLGNNKLSKITKPVPLPGAIVDYASLGATEFFAGDKISGCYQSCK